MASSDYWKQREADWQKECQKNNVNWQKEIEDVYQTMSDEINDQVLIFYQKYADENGLTLAQAKQYLDQTDIRYYANLAKRYCEDAARDMDAGTWEYSPAKSYFTRQADEEMKRYNTAMKISRLQMLKHQMDLRIANAQRKVCSVVHDALTDRALQTYTRQSGILGKTVLNNLAHVQTIVKASFHGANFSQRIWGTQQDKLKKVLTKSLQDCLILGKGAAPFARELKKQTGKSIRQAQTLMSTELARVQVQAALDSMQASDFDEFQVVSSPDCCDECQKIDGQHYPIPKLASGENAPPMHPNCRCSIAPYEARNEDGDDDFDEDAFDEWSETYDEHGLSWEDWKKQKGQEKRRDKSDHIGKLIEDPTLGEVTIAAVVGRSAGARAKNYEIEDKVTGEVFYLAEGSRITQPKNHVMAGKGRNRQIDCIDYLLDKYPGTDPDQWTKEKGYGYIINEYGEEELVELHFYREPSVGMVEFKIKYDAYGNREII